MTGRTGVATTGRTTRERPPHGTTARAKGLPAKGVKGCGCYRCRGAENRYNKHRRYLNATGRPVRVPAGPAAEHLRALFDAGMTWPAICEASGCSAGTVSSLLHGQAVMRRSVALRILAVRATPQGHVPVDATGTVRRVRALYAAGWMQRAIADAAGVDRSTVSDLLAGRLSQVRVATARAVATAFAALEMRRAPDGLGAVRARNRGVREGWAVPLAWGEDIDDPAAKPRGVAPVVPRIEACEQPCL